MIGDVRGCGMSAFKLVEALLTLQGCPVHSECRLWTEGSAERFLKRFPHPRPGSVAELVAVLRLLDERAEVETSEADHAPVRPRPAEAGRMPIAVLGPSRNVTVWIRLRRFELIEHAQAVARVVGRVINWWHPLGIDRVEWRMRWEGAALVVAPESAIDEQLEEQHMEDTRRLMEEYAACFLNVRRRGAQPSRTLISVTAPAAIRREAGQVVLADKQWERFLSNSGAFTVSWRVLEEHHAARRTEMSLVALRDGIDRLDMLAPASFDRRATWALNGHPVRRRPVADWPELYSFDLDEPLHVGATVKLTCSYRQRSSAKANRPLVFVNPVVFEATSWDEERQVYKPTLRGKSDPPGTYLSFVAGQDGLESFQQPIRLVPGQPAESDESLFARASLALSGRIERRSDICRMVLARFPDVSGIDFTEATWLDNGPPPKLVDGIQVRLRPSTTASPGRRVRLQVCTQRFLEAYLRVLTKVSVTMEANDG
jgi:hypothetical protein